MRKPKPDLTARVAFLENTLTAALAENAALKAGDLGPVVGALKVQLATLKAERDALAERLQTALASYVPPGFDIEEAREHIAALQRIRDGLTLERDEAVKQRDEALKKLRASEYDASSLKVQLGLKDFEISLLKMRPGGATPSPAIPQDQWRRLVQLAHPDKHAGSDAANEATRWLMENRP